MLRHYLASAIRNIYQHRIQSLVTVGGFALGFACVVLILLFVRHQLSFDEWLPNSERIYRIEGTYTLSGHDPVPSARTAGPVRAAFENYFRDEFETVTRLYDDEELMVIGDREFHERMILADPNMFEVLNLPLVAGNPETVLRTPDGLVMSETAKRKYFGDGPALGRSVATDDGIEFHVTGIMKNLPDNTHLHVEMIAFLDPNRLSSAEMESWTFESMYTYVLLPPGADPARIEDQLEDFAQANAAVSNPNVNVEEYFDYELVALEDIHLKSTKSDDMTPPGNLGLVYAFAAIAILVLLVASFNYVNLLTARATCRGREVALRKVAGAEVPQLVAQFLAESLIMAVASLVIAFTFVEAVLPLYNALLGDSLSLDPVHDAGLLLQMFAAGLLVSLAGAVYPAVRLARIKPAHALGHHDAPRIADSNIKDVLVFLQYGVTIALLIATAVVFIQTLYARSLDPGFDQDLQVVLNVDEIDDADALQRLTTLKTELERSANVFSTTMASDVPPLRNVITLVLERPATANTETVASEVLSVDYNFFEHFGVELLAGRTFAGNFDGDLMPTNFDEAVTLTTSALVINERAARMLGFASPRDALGEYARMQVRATRIEAPIVGVVGDILLRSAHETIPPTIFARWRADNFVIVKIRAEDVADTLGYIDRTWERVLPDFPLNRTFLAENLAAKYLHEERQFTVFAGFSVLTIVISSLGLFAMATFVAERRTREIGIRKVLGARIKDIVRLMIWEFSKPVLFANVIAWPMAWWFMRDWLQGFAYRIELSPAYFILAGLAALLIAWATVAYHAWRAARTNPVHALRYE